MPAPVGIIASSMSGAKLQPPLPIPDCSFWFDADNEATIAFGAGTSVASWLDLSGNARNASEASATRQPTRTIGGLRADRYSLNFDSNLAQRLVLPAGYANMKPFTEFIVAKPTDGTYNDMVGSVDSGGALVRTSPSHVVQFDQQYTAGVGAANTALLTTAANVVAVSYGSLGEWAFWRNGVADGAGTTDRTFNSPGNQVVIGAGGPAEEYMGVIGEVIKYSRVLTTAEIDELNAYLVGRWL